MLSKFQTEGFWIDSAFPLFPVSLLSLEAFFQLEIPHQLPSGYIWKQGHHFAHQKSSWPGPFHSVRVVPLNLPISCSFHFTTQHFLLHLPSSTLSSEGSAIFAGEFSFCGICLELSSCCSFQTFRLPASSFPGSVFPIMVWGRWEC